MGMLDFFKKKEEPKQETVNEESEEACALCGRTGADKKFGGQYFHKKCVRQAKKAARKMI
jgi:hypothetical protein